MPERTPLRPVQDLDDGRVVRLFGRTYYWRRVNGRLELRRPETAGAGLYPRAPRPGTSVADDA